MRRVLLVLAVLLGMSCKIERRPTDPETPITQVLVLPDTIEIDPLGSWQFGAFGRTRDGDSVPVSVQWSASAGEITSAALFTADSSEDDVTVTAAMSGSPALRGSALVRKHRVVQIIITPDAATLLPGATQQFGARGVRNVGDTIGIAVIYSATGGTVNTAGLFTAGSVPGTYQVIARRRALADTAVITILNPPVASVTVSPSSANLYVGRTTQLTATARDAAGNVLTGRTITWSSNAPAVASVSTGGMVTAASVGAATITATSEGQSGSATITVAVVPVASVVVTPASATLRVTTTAQLSAVTKDSAGNTLTGRSVTWSSNAPGVASVSANGGVTAVAAGSATITASSEGKSGSSGITVTVVPVASVTVAPAAANLLVGTGTQLSATTKDSAGNVLNGRVVTWSSNTPGVAMVSASGLVTAVAAGSATITATSEGKSATATITVTLVPVATVTVAPATATLRIGTTKQLGATLQDAAGTPLTGRSVTWSSSAPSVATVSTSGLVTAVGVGSATITATSEGKSGTSTITVTLVPVASVTLTPATVTLAVAATQQLTAVTKDSAGNTLTGRAVTWSSDAPAVATVSAAGLVTAVTVGTATITATSEGKTGTASVTVSAVPVASVTVAPATVTLRVGTTGQLTATTLDAAGNPLTGRSVTWSSSASSVATVSTSGLVSAVTAGSATITATSEGKSATATITVTLVPVATVTVAPATATLRIGTTRQLTATTRDSAGNTLTGRTVTWSSNATGVATVSTSGLVSAVAPGSATMTATSEGKSGTSTFTVTVIPVATVTVTPATASLALLATQQLTAVTKDSAGNVLTGRSVTWSSTATGVATVSAAGLVTAVAVGSATITATSEGKSGSASITVTGSTPPRVGRYVAVTGTSGGDGTIARPWDLVTALAGAGGRIQPGDTVWIRGGRYLGSFTSTLRGTSAAPIVVRAYPGERVTLDGTPSSSITLNLDGTWTTYWGFEITNTILTRFGSGLAARPSGIYVRNASNLRLVNLIIHETGHGVYLENSADNIEIYGWIVYNGGNDNSSRSDGHGIYIRNDGSTQKRVLDNVIFNQFGFGIHAYAEGGDLLNNMLFEGNVVFNNGELSAFDSPNMILGGDLPADRDTVRNNVFYFSGSRGPRNVRLGYTTAMNGSGVFDGNYVVGGGTQAVDITYWQNLLVRNNTFVETGRVLALADPATSNYSWAANNHYRDPTATAWRFRTTDHTFNDWKQATGLGATDWVGGGTPAQPYIMVRPNRYEPGRATVTVVNWGRQPSVQVDLASVLTVGQRFEIRNVQDFFGSPVASGTYGGGSVAFPMGGVAPPAPVGGSPTAPLRTGPDFDVFVVIPVP